MRKAPAVTDLKLIFLYMTICLTLVIRIYAESTGYISLDSRYYLEVSQNILEGKGPYITWNVPADEDKNQENQVLYIAWPLGYPLLISMVSKITGLGVFWSSKVVNMLSLGLIFLLLRIYYPRAAFACALYFCSFAMLENFSYTWSEGPFLLFVLIFCIALERYLAQSSRSALLMVVASAICMFLMRYVGLISAFFTGLVNLYFLLYKKDWKKGFSLMAASLVSAAAAFTYFLMNYLLAGSPWGGQRETTEADTDILLFLDFLKGIFNSLFIFRNYYFQLPVDWLFIILGLIQFAVLGLAFYKVIYKKINLSFTSRDRTSLLLLGFGLLYIIFLIILKSLTHFDNFNYRI
ncbi:hypothetical protein BH23BAC1_BH23BAC1_50820 [soil metagenome]